MRIQNACFFPSFSSSPQCIIARFKLKDIHFLILQHIYNFVQVPYKCKEIESYLFI